MEELIYNWTPQLIVEVIKAVAWPLTLLLIGLRFRSGIYDSIRSFFSKNTVTEVSATASGVSAKFVAAKQSTETKESAGSSAVSLPKNISAESIRQRHEQNKTDLSEEFYRSIKNHLLALTLSPDEEIEILAKEVSQLQSAVRYFDINKVLFRSQFNLFSLMRNNDGYISKEDINRYFLANKNEFVEAFLDWDLVKYISFPVSNGFISDDGNGYQLTTLGNSYVAFMSRNPQLVNELAKL
jgi:hypothetical protein